VGNIRRILRSWGLTNFSAQRPVLLVGQEFEILKDWMPFGRKAVHEVAIDLAHSVLSTTKILLRAATGIGHVIDGSTAYSC
jgi:hypothetical protein